MGTFEYITALVAVVVGLAIADIATSLHRLLRHRKIVRWDWVAPLAALLILTELFNFWFQWRSFTGTTMGEVAPYFLALFLIYLTASIALPDEVPEDGIDLGRYFDEVRSYFWFVYTSYVTVFITLATIRNVNRGLTFPELLQKFSFDYPWIVVGFCMIFVKKRWISGALLFVTLFWLVWEFDWWNKAPALPT